MFKKLLIFVVSAILVLGFLLGVQVYDFLWNPPSTQEQEVVFEVKPGPFAKVARDLFQKGLIKDERKFTYYARFTDQVRKVKVGEFLLKTNMTPGKVLETLVSGQMLHYEFTVQEGLNLYEVADILMEKKLADKEEFLRLVRSSSVIKPLLGEDLLSLEGYLFPDTYRVTKYDGARKIIETMVRRFLEVYTEVTSNLSSSQLAQFSRHEAVILASMIEKETGAPKERPLISSVFQNRLSKPMRLQSDPTILYGIMEKYGYWKKNIQKKDILEKTAYNTYRINGLPKGPIANPGKESLSAVFQPEKSSYYYFVSRNDGTHVFSETLKQHEAAVRKFQLDARARQGKSWRDLKKK